MSKYSEEIQESITNVLEDLLSQFIEAFHYMYPNLNDTFGYASADTEKLSVGDHGEMLARLWLRYGFIGIVAFVAKKRNAPPMPQFQTPEYDQALEDLRDYDFSEGE